MRVFRKIGSAFLGLFLVAGCFLSVPGDTAVAAAPVSPGRLTIDRKSATVKKAAQTITGRVPKSDGIRKVTYKVYSEVDEGLLSFEGEAKVKNGEYSAEGLKLKPNANKIVVTATYADGSKDEQSITLNYDSSFIKDPKAKNIAKAGGKGGPKYVNNNLLVFFEEGVDDERRQEIIDTVSGECAGYINGANMWQVEVKPASITALRKLAEKLSAMEGVFYAGPNMAGAAKAQKTTPADPWYSNGSPAWNELNPQGGNWSVEAVQALSAWDYQYFYNNIKVGIVDAGIQNDHEDLSGKVFFPNAQSAADNNPYDDHGTHVAGIMGAIPNNNLGVTGILWNTIMYAYNWDTIDGTDAHLYAGLTDTVQAGAKVVNFSLGLANDISGYGDPSVNQYVIDYAQQSAGVMTPLLNAGYDFIVVESSGNGQNGYSQDAIYNGYFCSVNYANCPGTTTMKNKINDRILVVGNAQRTGTLAFQQYRSSNAGSQVDICAPGTDIWSCYASDSYGYMTGTSMSSPLAAAVTALVWSVNPSLTGSQVRSLLLSNTSYTVADNTSVYHPLVNTYPMVNAKLAVEAAIATVEPDYAAVDAAVAEANALNANLYTPGSWAALTAAVNAVDHNLTYLQQPQIDTMAANITGAIAGLVLKTVSYTVEYRLNAADGVKLAADKSASGQVTKTVTEQAVPVSGYTPVTAQKSLKLELEGNLIVFIYTDRPIFTLRLETLKESGGQLVSVATARAGDILTVRVTPSTNFYCGSSRFIVMYDQNFYSLLDSGNAAFSVNPANSYFTGTVASYGGVTSSPLAQWPATFVNGESSLYRFTSTAFNAVSMGYPSLINGSEWLFSFKLQVKEGAAGSGRIFMDDRWTCNINNPTGPQYFNWCADGTVTNVNGKSQMDFLGNYENADISVALDTTQPPVLSAKAGSTTQINGAAGLITGLEEGLTPARFLSEFVVTTGNAALRITPDDGMMGTGTRVELIDNSTQAVTAAYTVVIFGDTDGDGFADGRDTAIVNMIAAGMLDRSQTGEAVYLAADADRDGAVDTADAVLLENAGLFLAAVSQTTV